MSVIYFNSRTIIWMFRICSKFMTDGLAALLALSLFMVALSRMYLAAHFPHQVICGAIAGKCIKFALRILHLATTGEMDLNIAYVREIHVPRSWKNACCCLVKLLLGPMVYIACRIMKEFYNMDVPKESWLHARLSKFINNRFTQTHSQRQPIIKRILDESCT